MKKKKIQLDQFSPIYSPRSQYTSILEQDQNLLSDLTLNFDPFTINVLKNEFRNHNWEMNLQLFILIVQDHLLSWLTDLKDREFQLARCLTLLFEEIDLNGNGLVEWDEFTNYIIQKANVLNNVKIKQDEIKEYVRSSYRPNKKFNNLITKIIYIQDIDKIAFLEDGTDQVQFLQQENTLQIKPLKIIPAPLVVETTFSKKKNGKKEIYKNQSSVERKTKILDLIYIPDKKYQILITSTNDGYIRGWKYTNNGYVIANQPENEEQQFQRHFQNEIYCLAWDSINKILYCGEESGIIIEWNLKADTEYALESQQAHKLVVMDMIPMPKIQLLASASLDSKLILWDTIGNKVKRVFSEHTRGILSLAFHEQLILLFSAGFDHFLCVWNPFIDSIVYKIQDHSSQLVCVKVLQGTHQVVSMDSIGMVKVWDARKFQCVQSFSLEQIDKKNKFNPQSFCYIKNAQKLIFAGRTVDIYEQDKNYNPHTIDDLISLSCKYVPHLLIFLTPIGSKINVWNALTGELKQFYSDGTNYEITAFNLDEMNKRIIYGNFKGFVILMNVMNGAKIKNLPSHSSEVTNVLHIKSLNSFLSSSMDGKIIMSSDNDFGQSLITKIFTTNDSMITQLIYDEMNEIIISSNNIGEIYFFEKDQKEKLDKQDINQIEEVSSLNLIYGLPFLIYCTTLGKINIVSTPPLIQRYISVFSYVNTDNDVDGVGISNGIYYVENKKLYISDDKGQIKCFDFSDIIQELTKCCQITNFNNKQKINFTTIQNFPNVRNTSIHLIWQIKAHSEIVKSLNLIKNEKLIISTSYDRKIKIFNSDNGVLIEQLQVNQIEKMLKPIAYQLKSTSEIYDCQFDKRIDISYCSSLKRALKTSIDQSPNTIQQLVQEYQKKDQRKITSSDIFNPFFLINSIDQSLLKEKISNFDWKLNVDFEKLYKKSENKIKEILIFLENKECEIYIKDQKEGSKSQKITQQYDIKTNKNQKIKFQLPVIKNPQQKHKQVIDGSDYEMSNLSNNRFRTSTLHTTLSQKGLETSLLSISKGKMVKMESERSLDRFSLHKQELRCKMMYKHEPIIYLSKEEGNACYKLAASLSNYESDDSRIIKFMNFKIKNEKLLK